MNTRTEVVDGAHSKLCFPAFMSIELKVSAWGHRMIERCDMETQAGSHCQRHGSHLTPQALSPWPPPTLAALAFFSPACFVAFAELKWICPFLMHRYAVY